KSLILRDPDVIERLAVLRITKQANFPSPKGFVPQLQQLSRVQPSFYDLALNRHCNCDHTAGPIAFLDGPKLSVVRAFSLVQSGQWAATQPVLEKQQPIKMFRILISKHDAEAVIVSRTRPHCHSVVCPRHIAGNQVSSVPAPDKIASTTPNVAPLMKPAVGLALPL